VGFKKNGCFLGRFFYNSPALYTESNATSTSQGVFKCSTSEDETLKVFIRANNADAALTNYDTHGLVSSVRKIHCRISGSKCKDMEENF